LREWVKVGGLGKVYDRKGDTRTRKGSWTGIWGEESGSGETCHSGGKNAGLRTDLFEESEIKSELMPPGGTLQNQTPCSRKKKFWTVGKKGKPEFLSFAGRTRLHKIEQG